MVWWDRNSESQFHLHACSLTAVATAQLLWRCRWWSFHEIFGTCKINIATCIYMIWTCWPIPGFNLSWLCCLASHQNQQQEWKKKHWTDGIYLEGNKDICQCHTKTNGFNPISFRRGHSRMLVNKSKILSMLLAVELVLNRVHTLSPNTQKKLKTFANALQRQKDAI